MKKLMVFAILMVATLSISFAQTKMSKEAPTMRKERASKGTKTDKIKAAMEEAGVPLNQDQITRLEATYKAQKEKIRAIRTDETFDDAAKKEALKEVKQNTKNEIATFLSKDQVAVLGTLKKQKRGKVDKVRGNNVKVDPAKKADLRLTKISDTLESANVPLSEDQAAQLRELFLEEATAQKAAKTQSRSEMGVKDIQKNIRTEYREKVKTVLTKEQSKALKATRKSAKSKI